MLITIIFICDGYQGQIPSLHVTISQLIMKCSQEFFIIIIYQFTNIKIRRHLSQFKLFKSTDEVNPFRNE